MQNTNRENSIFTGKVQKLTEILQKTINIPTAAPKSFKICTKTCKVEAQKAKTEDYRRKMAFININENIHTRAFTPRDFHVELISAAKEKNIIICLDQNKEFIVHQLVIEFSQEIRNGKKAIS